MSEENIQDTVTNEHYELQQVLLVTEQFIDFLMFLYEADNYNSVAKKATERLFKRINEVIVRETEKNAPVAYITALGLQRLTLKNLLEKSVSVQKASPQINQVVHQMKGGTLSGSTYNVNAGYVSDMHIGETHIN